MRRRCSRARSTSTTGCARRPRAICSSGACRGRRGPSAPGDRAHRACGRGVARGREGHRRVPPRRPVRRAGAPLLHRGRTRRRARGAASRVSTSTRRCATSRPMLNRFGGHAAAVGLALPASSLGRVPRARLSHGSPGCPAADVRSATRDRRRGAPRRAVASSSPPELALLGPFGFGNPRPLLAARGVFMNGRQRVGKAEEHLRFTAYDGVAAVPAIAFRCPDIETLAEHRDARSTSRTSSSATSGGASSACSCSCATSRAAAASHGRSGGRRSSRTCSRHAERSSRGASTRASRTRTRSTPSSPA